MRQLLKKTDGFTLIELLAVIVILAVVMLLAGSNVFNVMGDARKGAFRTEFLGLLDSAQLRAQADMMYGKGLVKAGDSVCYCIGATCTGDGKTLLTEFDNKGNYTGSVSVTLNSGGTLTITGWMNSSAFITSNQDISIDKEDITDYTGTAASISCGK